MRRHGAGRIDRRYLQGSSKKAIFPLAVGQVYFSTDLSKEPQLMARLSGPITRKITMADVKAPQHLDPRDIVKLLVALRRALKKPPA